MPGQRCKHIRGEYCSPSDSKWLNCSAVWFWLRSKMARCVNVWKEKENIYLGKGALCLPSDVLRLSCCSNSSSSLCCEWIPWVLGVGLLSLLSHVDGQKGQLGDCFIAPQNIYKLCSWLDRCKGSADAVVHLHLSRRFTHLRELWICDKCWILTRTFGL